MGLGEFHSPRILSRRVTFGLAMIWTQRLFSSSPPLMGRRNKVQAAEGEGGRWGMGVGERQHRPAPAYLFILGKTGVASKTQISQSVKHQQRENSQGSAQHSSARPAVRAWRGRLLRLPSSPVCRQTSSAPCDLRLSALNWIPIPMLLFWILSIILLWLLQQSGRMYVNRSIGICKWLS